MNRLYKTNSGLSAGTLFQLRNLINRRNITAGVTKDMNANEDFLELMVALHVIAAAVQLVGSNSVEEMHAKLTSDGQNLQLNALALSVCDTYIDLEFSPNDVPARKQSDPDHTMSMPERPCH